MFRIRLTAALSALAVSLPLALALPSAPASALPAWENHNSTWPNPAARAPRVVDLAYAAHGRYDRVVITVRGRIPGDAVRYGRNFTYDGSGKPVPIHGRAGLQLSLAPAYAHNRHGDDVYDGPHIARPHFDTLRALAFTGDFEGQVSFAFALTHRADYRVFRLHDPQRLVIDFRH
ncbi:hypothetical protein [Nocardioides sp.]|jgi:hypothetical protein|uniref:AMIN-like domain-containing (lipo)protein n=1 Tax=Nocardioides sp. TaxID=35761 RepID=UPI0031FF128C|nr:hypothetical protein [Nocardioides sp.]